MRQKIALSGKMEASASSGYGSVLTGLTLHAAMEINQEVFVDMAASEGSVNQVTDTDSNGGVESAVSRTSIQNLSFYGDSHVASFWVGDGPEDRVDAAMEPEAGGVVGMGEHDNAGVAWADLVDAVHIEDGDPSAAPLGFGGRRWRRSCKPASEASMAWMNLKEQGWCG